MCPPWASNFRGEKKGKCMSTELIAALALRLFKEYTKLAKDGELDLDFVPRSADEIATALTSLVPGMVNLGKATSVTSTLLKKVESQIKTLQGFGGLMQDGILGERTLNWLTGIKRCKGELAHTPSTTEVPRPETRDPRKIRYWYGRNGLPQVPDGDPEILLAKAWISWIKVVKLDVQRAKSKAGANVIVTTVPMDGKGGTLADAHVGPPKGMQMELRFDKSETWNANKFQGTAAHEIGHLLGLGHASGPGELMSPLFQPAIITPQEGDATRILTKNWKKQKPKPKPRVVAPKPGKPIIPEL